MDVALSKILSDSKSFPGAFLMPVVLSGCTSLCLRDRRQNGELKGPPTTAEVGKYCPEHLYPMRMQPCGSRSAFRQSWLGMIGFASCNTSQSSPLLAASDLISSMLVLVHMHAFVFQTLRMRSKRPYGHYD
jgi:hypothetical protein